MTMKVAAVVMLAGSALAQGTSPQDGVAALKASLAENAAKLRTYAWVETTQVTMKGEVKKQEQKQCYYGADGKVQKTPMPGAAAPAKPASDDKGGRGGRVKGRIVENKVEELTDYMEKVVALVHAYVPPNPEKIQAAQAAGNVSAQPSGAVTNITVKNYAKNGDLLAIGLDPAVKRLTSYRVESFVEEPKDDDVKLNVTFATLPDDTSYPGQIVLDVAAKQIQVKITNSGYKKAGS